MISKDKLTVEIKKKAEGYFLKGSLKKALDEYIVLKDLLPKDMRIVQKIADIYHKMGDLDKAKINYKTAAEYFTKEGYWAKAVALNKIIIGIDPDDKDVQKQISEIYTSKGLSSQRLLVMPRKIKQKEDKIEAETVEQQQEPSSDESQGFNIPLFSDLKTEAMSELLERLAVRRIPKGEMICRDGDPGDSMFVISEGWVEIFNQSQAEGKTTLTSLKDGDFFGEFGLLTDGRRHAWASAKTDTVLLEITARHFDDLAAKYPNVPVILNHYFNTRMFDNVLRKSRLFESLFTAERLEVVKQFKAGSFAKGSFIFKEGDPGDRVYFVKSGEAEVSVSKNNAQMVVARLTTGDFFGEIALLSDQPRTASVRASQDLDILYLDSPSFKRILNKYPDIESKIMSTMEERAKDTVDAFQSHEEMKRCLGMV
jgi:cAMP-dependent protein kinase regulator